MTTVTKIDQVYLYTSGASGGKAELAARKLLDESGIKYVELAYNDPSEHSQVFKALNTWHWGVDKSNRVFTSMPIVHWKEYYDDLFQMDFNTVGVDELKKSSLLKNKSVVV